MQLLTAKTWTQVRVILFVLQHFVNFASAYTIADTVIYAGTNFHETGQNLGFRIFVVSESGTD